MVKAIQEDQSEVGLWHDKVAKCLNISSMEGKTANGCNATLMHYPRLKVTSSYNTMKKIDYISYKSEFKDFQSQYLVDVKWAVHSAQDCAAQCESFSSEQRSKYNKAGRGGERGCAEERDRAYDLGFGQDAVDAYNDCMSHVEATQRTSAHSYPLPQCSVALWMPKTKKCRYLAYGKFSDMKGVPIASKADTRVQVIERFEACPCSPDKLQEFDAEIIKLQHKLAEDNEDNKCAIAIGKKNLHSCADFLHLPLNTKGALCFGLDVGFSIAEMVGNKVANLALAETGYTELTAPIKATEICDLTQRLIPDDKGISTVAGKAKSAGLKALRNVLGKGLDKLIDMFTNLVEKGMEGRMPKSKASNIANETNQILKGVLGRGLELTWELQTAMQHFVCGSPVSAVFDLIKPIVQCWTRCKKDRCVFGPVPYVDKAPEEEEGRYDTIEDDEQICKCGPDWHHGEFMSKYDYDSLKCKQFNFTHAPTSAPTVSPPPTPSVVKSRDWSAYSDRENVAFMAEHCKKPTYDLFGPVITNPKDMRTVNMLYMLCDGIIKCDNNPNNACLQQNRKLVDYVKHPSI